MLELTGEFHSLETNSDGYTSLIVAVTSDGWLGVEERKGERISVPEDSVPAFRSIVKKTKCEQGDTVKVQVRVFAGSNKQGGAYLAMTATSDLEVLNDHELANT